MNFSNRTLDCSLYINELLPRYTLIYFSPFMNNFSLAQDYSGLLKHPRLTIVALVTMPRGWRAKTIQNESGSCYELVDKRRGIRRFTTGLNSPINPIWIYLFQRSYSSQDKLDGAEGRFSRLDLQWRIWGGFFSTVINIAKRTLYTHSFRFYDSPKSHQTHLINLIC